MSNETTMSGASWRFVERRDAIPKWLVYDSFFVIGKASENLRTECKVKASLQGLAVLGCKVNILGNVNMCGITRIQIFQF